MSAESSSPAISAGAGAAASSYVNIFGMRGMGKTTLLRTTVAGVVRAGRSCTVVDSNGVLRDLVQLGAGRAECAVVETPAGWWSTVRRALQARRPWCVVVVPRGELRALWTMLDEVGRQTLAVDEMEAYANAGNTDPALQKIIAQGRNRWISLICTVRLPPELSKQLRGLADVQISFRQQSPDYAAQIARECLHQPAAAALLQQLSRLHYLHYDGSTQTLSRGRVDPARPL